MHMAFLSRGFKNLQWYSMTIKKSRMALFLLAETGERRPLHKPPVSALIKRDGGTRKRFPHHTARSTIRNPHIECGLLMVKPGNADLCISHRFQP